MTVVRREDVRRVTGDTVLLVVSGNNGEGDGVT